MDVAERFWAKVLIAGPDECWEWQAGKAHGYGSVRVKGRHHHAHRLAWSLSNGQEVPEGKHVLHHCDNRPCVNPAHLYIGTDADNARDRVQRGRQNTSWAPAIAQRKPGWNRKSREDDRRGGRKPKLPPEREQEVAARYRAGGVSKSALAREYGVSQPTVTAIIARRRDQ